MKRGKFTDDEVRGIRQSRRPVRALAEEFGVSSTTIQKIRARRTYKYVPDDQERSSETPMGLHTNMNFVKTETPTDDEIRGTRPAERLGADTPFQRYLEQWGETESLKLTEDAVREIRQSRRSARVLADYYGVSHPTIIRAKKRQSYKHVPDDPEDFRNQYVREYALDFLLGLPSGYCPTIVTSPPLFSMSNYPRRYMSRDEALDRYIYGQLKIIKECIRVAGDEGIVLYHTETDSRSERLHHYNQHELSSGSHSPPPEIIVWNHITPNPHSSRWHDTESFILMFKGRDWTVPGTSSAKEPISGATWDIAPIDEQCYKRKAEHDRLMYEYSESTHQRYLRRWWYSFPDELADRSISLGKGRVFDPFAGTGAIPLAAIRAGRPWLACDTRPTLMKIFCESKREYE